jgi:protein arginine N-methyltransferase 1
MAVNNNAAAAQPALKADDPMAGMAHSEAHYFNRFVEC